MMQRMFRRAMFTSMMMGTVGVFMGSSWRRKRREKEQMAQQQEQMNQQQQMMNQQQQMMAQQQMQMSQQNGNVPPPVPQVVSDEKYERPPPAYSSTLNSPAMA